MIHAFWTFWNSMTSVSSQLEVLRVSGRFSLSLSPPLIGLFFHAPSHPLHLFDQLFFDLLLLCTQSPEGHPATAMSISLPHISVFWVDPGLPPVDVASSSLRKAKETASQGLCTFRVSSFLEGLVLSVSTSGRKQPQMHIQEIKCKLDIILGVLSREHWEVGRTLWCVFSLFISPLPHIGSERCNTYWSHNLYSFENKIDLNPARAQFGRDFLIWRWSPPLSSLFCCWTRNTKIQPLG